MHKLGTGRPEFEPHTVPANPVRSNLRAWAALETAVPVLPGGGVPQYRLRSGNGSLDVNNLSSDCSGVLPVVPHVPREDERPGGALPVTKPLQHRAGGAPPERTGVNAPRMQGCRAERPIQFKL